MIKRKSYIYIFFFFLLSTIGCNRKEQKTSIRTQIDTDTSVLLGEIVTEHTPLLITPDASNILAIDFFDIQTKTNIQKTISFSIVKEKVNQQKESYIIYYPFYIEESIDFSTLRFALYKGNYQQVRINNHLVYPIPSSYFINDNFQLYEIGQYCYEGENKCSVELKPADTPKQMGYILGNFSVFPTEKGFELKSPLPLQTGYWLDQGMPFYGYAVTYSKIYTFQPPFIYLLSLPEWEGSSAEIYINNNSIGNIKNTSEKINISDHIIAGENRIDIKVFGFINNITGPFYLLDTLQHIPLPGDRYSFLPAGLSGDFSIEQYKPSK